jgi:hypothetical protein
MKKIKEKFEYFENEILPQCSPVMRAIIILTPPYLLSFLITMLIGYFFWF